MASTQMLNSLEMIRHCSFVHNITDSANLLNSDLSKINEWVIQWKISLNPNPTKKAEEISRKTSQVNH